MTFKFKTNINTIDCVQRVSPYLEDEMAITFWHVDTDMANKTLIVETEKLNPSEIIAILRKAGFIANLLKKQTIN